MKDRLGELQPDSLNPEQKQVYDDINSRRGNVGGLFQVWLRNPVLAERAQKLGAYCRYDTSLPAILSELAILVVARHWRAQVEWAIHAPIAQDAGIPASAIEDILAGRDPQLDNPAAQLVYSYTKELLQNSRVSQSLHDRAFEELGEAGLIDLVAVVGYYGFVSLTLNAFEVSVPNGAPMPFPE